MVLLIADGWRAVEESQRLSRLMMEQVWGVWLELIEAGLYVKSWLRNRKCRALRQEIGTLGEKSA